MSINDYGTRNYYGSKEEAMITWNRREKDGIQVDFAGDYQN